MYWFVTVLKRDKDSNLSSRLQRLVEAEICPAEDVKKYAQELRELTDRIADKKIVKMESSFFKALANDTRIKILKLLGLRRMCVCEIMVALNLTQPTASHHLGILESVGIIKDEREGKWIFYSIAKPKIIDVLKKIEEEIIE